MDAMDSPVKLLEWQGKDGHRILSVRSEAETVLSNLPAQPLDVVVVAGPIRKGKSYLCNKLMGRNDGFSLGDTFDSATKDMWFWIRKHPAADDRYLMVIDTEGLGDYMDVHQKDKDVKNLVLMTLLSSHLVFNLQGNPDDSLLSNLRLMGELARHIRLDTEDTCKAYEVSDQFPELWVTLQDVFLQTPKRNNRELTPDQFLDEILQKKKGSKAEVGVHNAMTDALKTFFHRRHLQLLPVPVDSPEKLRKLDQLRDADLNPDYCSAINTFTRELWESLQAKRINGDVVTSPAAWLELLRSFVDKLNDPEAVPSIQGAYDSMVKNESYRAMQAALDQHSLAMDQVTLKLPMNTSQLESETTAAQAEAEQTFNKSAGRWDKQGEWLSKLKFHLQERHEAILHTNHVKSRETCKQILREVDGFVRDSLQRGDYNKVNGAGEYVQHMDRVKGEYKKRAEDKGPAFPEVLEAFLEGEEKLRKAQLIAACNKLKEVEARHDQEKQEQWGNTLKLINNLTKKSNSDKRRKCVLL